MTSFVAELPFGDGKPFPRSGIGAAALGGWTVSGILTGRSGRPFKTQGSLEGATRVVKPPPTVDGPWRPITPVLALAGATPRWMDSRRA